MNMQDIIFRGASGIFGDLCQIYIGSRHNGSSFEYALYGVRKTFQGTFDIKLTEFMDFKKAESILVHAWAQLKNNHDTVELYVS